MKLGSLFQRKKCVFRRKDKIAWEAAKSALQSAGIGDFSARSYEDEAGGCG